MVTFFFWILAFTVAFLTEVSFLPRFFGAGFPVVSFALVLLGIAHQGFWGGLVFAGISGIIRDLLAASTEAGHTIFFLVIFFMMAVFRRFSGWDEPARRIGTVAVGLGAMPFLGIVGMRLEHWFFHFMPLGFSLGDRLSRYGRGEVVFTLVWFFAFVWISIRWSRRQGSKALARLA